MKTQIKLNAVQTAIQKEIEDFIIRSDDMMQCDRQSRYSASKSLMYCFHDNKSIFVDGDLYDILYYGHADYNFGSILYVKIHEIVDQHGYCLEYEGQGIYNIKKELR